MAAYNKFNQFVEDLAEGVHTCSTDQFVVALTNSAPVATNTVLANITQIAYTNLSSRNLTTSTSSQTGGTFTQLFADLTLTSTGGSTGPFRYIVVYNDTPTSPVDPLVCWYDYGSALTLADGESLDIDFTTSTFTIA
jgi:hypothetical protein